MVQFSMDYGTKFYGHTVTFFTISDHWVNTICHYKFTADLPLNLVPKYENDIKVSSCQKFFIT